MFYPLAHFWNCHKSQSSRLLSPFYTCACLDSHAPTNMHFSGFYKSLAFGLRWEQRLTVPFSTVFPGLLLHRNSYKHMKAAKNTKMLELIPYGLFRWHQIPTYSQMGIWVQQNNRCPIQDTRARIDGAPHTVLQCLQPFSNFTAVLGHGLFQEGWGFVPFVRQ